MKDFHKDRRIAVLGAGLAGCAAALEAVRLGFKVDLFDRFAYPMAGASLHNEGKLHLGYVYAADPERATHRRLAEGSLRFLSDIEVLTGAPRSSAPLSRPFHYGVPHDSLLTLDQVRDHMAAVDDVIVELIRSGHAIDFPFSPALSTNALDAGVNADMVAGVFKTSEIAVETGWVSDLVGASVLASPDICFLGRHEIREASILSDGACVEWSGPEGEGRTRYQGIVNALWQNRARFDAMAGLDVPADQWLRYKAAVRVDRLDPFIAKILPSLTLITGPYGDLVNHGDGTAYVSWYPVCKLGETEGLDARVLEHITKTASDEDLAIDSIEAMARYAPQARHLLARSDRLKVGGGIIVARGRCDIDRPESGLHQRSDIGVRDHGAWVSIDSGKYCTAPWFGRQASQTLARTVAA